MSGNIYTKVLKQYTKTNWIIIMITCMQANLKVEVD